MLVRTRCPLPWHSMPGARAIGIESSRSRSKSNGQSSVVWSRKLKEQVPSLMLQAREDSVSIALALDAGCKGNRYRVLTIKEQVHRAISICLVPQAQRNKSHR